MLKEHVIQDLPITEELKEAGINVEVGFSAVVNQLTDRIKNRDFAERVALRAAGLTLHEIANSWDKNGFRGLSSGTVRKSIRKGLERLNEQYA